MDKSYRQGVVVIITDKHFNFLLVQLDNYQPNEWNFIGKGNIADHSLEVVEATTKSTLQDKLNIAEADMEIISIAKDPIQYDFPEAQVKDAGELYHGQAKIPVVVRYTGDLNRIKPLWSRIKALKWVAFDELEQHLVFPKQYEQLELVLSSLKKLYLFLSELQKKS